MFVCKSQIFRNPTFKISLFSAFFHNWVDHLKYRAQVRFIADFSERLLICRLILGTCVCAVQTAPHELSVPDYLYEQDMCNLLRNKTRFPPCFHIPKTMSLCSFEFCSRKIAVSFNETLNFFRGNSNVYISGADITPENKVTTKLLFKQAFRNKIT